MEANPKQQTLKLIKDSKNILLLTHENMDGDGIGAMISLYLVLQKLGKKVTAYSLDPVPSALSFLPEVESYIKNSLSSHNDFIITLDCSKTKAEKLKYNIEDNKINIIITPKDGGFSAHDISTNEGASEYDTIITLDAGDKEHLGKIYTDNPNLFYNANVINIDHHITNTHFGTANLVDPKATSTCEIILSLIEALESQNATKLLDETIATYLLTGVTLDTNSFQNSNVTPKAFSVAAQLLALGADQQKIIKNLYHTHSLAKLKLWGRALSNIKEDKETGIVWSIISKHDFEDTGATKDETTGVLDELITSAPGASIVFLLVEGDDEQAHCSIRTLDSTDAAKLAKMFNGGGHKRASGFKIKGDGLEKIENFIVKKFRDYKLGNKEIPMEDMSTGVGKPEEKPERAIPNKEETDKFIKEAQEAASQPKEIPIESKEEAKLERPVINRPEEKKKEEDKPTESEPAKKPELPHEPKKEEGPGPDMAAPLL